MERINLFGASGHGKVIKSIITDSGREVGRFYDDFSSIDAVGESPVVRTSEEDVGGPLIISIGANKIRKDISERYSVKYAIAVHPSAIIAANVLIGGGTVVMQGAIIQTESTIGKHCIINTGASVDHECKIGDFVHISPHATLCGNVKIGEGSWIGAGATIIPGIRVGKWCEVGAGAAVIRDVPDGAVVVGVPAKIIKFKEGYS